MLESGLDMICTLRNRGGEEFLSGCTFMGWGIKWERMAPRALRLRLAMHLFVKYKPKKIFNFRNEGFTSLSHRSSGYGSILIQEYRRAFRVFFSSSKTSPSEVVHNLAWIFTSVQALSDSRTEAPLAIVHEIRLN